jgi:hypothetical protein
MAWLLVGLASASCSTTKFYQRERLADRCMTFDKDGRLIYLRNKTEAAREGGFGGFGGAAVGSCGCQ